MSNVPPWSEDGSERAWERAVARRSTDKGKRVSTETKDRGQNQCEGQASGHDQVDAGGGNCMDGRGS